MELNEVVVNFECEKCGNKEQVSISEILEGGNPLCLECDDSGLEMDAIDVEIVAPLLSSV